MRIRGIAVLLVSLAAFQAMAQVQPDVIGQEQMKPPEATWIMAGTFARPHIIFDLASGEMQGMLPLSVFTPAVEPNMDRGEIYAAESYYSRGSRGERTDIVNIYDMRTLSSVAEIEIPQKAAALPFRQYIGLLDDGKHLTVFNMTPAQSVTVVDIAERTFVTEISTPGCALVMPVQGSSFMQLCGDGTLQLISLDEEGMESGRSRSDVFFSVEDDPLYDKPVAMGNGWLHLSFEGQVFETSSKDGKIALSEPWSILNEEDKTDTWKPGGGQILAYHKNLDLMFTLMHQGGKDTHEDAGNEVWVLDRKAQRRISRIKLPADASNIFISQTEDPLLVVNDPEFNLHVFDVRTTKLVRTINEVSGDGLLQGF
jgi:methylamine dehydrogenase heavy chain